MFTRAVTLACLVLGAEAFMGVPLRTSVVRSRMTSRASMTSMDRPEIEVNSRSYEVGTQTRSPFFLTRPARRKLLSRVQRRVGFYVVLSSSVSLLRHKVLLFVVVRHGCACLMTPYVEHCHLMLIHS